MTTTFKRTGHAETDDVLARAEKVCAELTALADALRSMGADWRALDVDEAVKYVAGAVEFDT